MLSLQRAVTRGAIMVRKPWEETDDYGTVKFATIKTYGDTTHTFIDRSKYNGPFLPGYKLIDKNDHILSNLYAILCSVACIINNFM